MTDKQFIEQEREKWYPLPGSLDREEFPACGSISGAALYRLLPVPRERQTPEVIHLKQSYAAAESDLLIGQWNFAWEAGQLRYGIFQSEIPDELKWLERYADVNINLIPFSPKRFYAHNHLLNLLPATTREKFGLPRFGRGLWPSRMDFWYESKLLPKDYEERLSKAFAYHIWPLLNSSSRLNGFSTSEPISLLAHNLNFWAPLLDRIIEERLLQAPLVEYASAKDEKDERRINRKMPEGITVQRPRMGSYVWMGEDEAWTVTKELVETADAHGKLRSILEAVKTHRVQDDFSDRWSYEKEDFERKLYRKRSKIKVTFVEIDNAAPVHSPTSEVHEKLVWEDFFALLNQKEKRIVVCLKNGITKLSDIGDVLGYANHTPVSKAMKAIRLKAQKLLG